MRKNGHFYIIWNVTIKKGRESRGLNHRYYIYIDILLEDLGESLWWELLSPRGVCMDMYFCLFV